MNDDPFMKLSGEKLRDPTLHAIVRFEVGKLAASLGLRMDFIDPNPITETWEHRPEGLSHADFIRLVECSGLRFKPFQINRAWNIVRRELNQEVTRLKDEMQTIVVSRARLEQIVKNFDEDVQNPLGVGPVIVNVYRSLLDHTLPAEPSS